MTDLPPDSDARPRAQVLTFEGKLDLSTVGGLHKALLVAGDRDIIVDLARVTQLGALAMQMLIAASAALQAKGHRLRLANISDRVIAQIGAMGMTPEAISGAGA
jgi:chemotaxis protein CheX